MTSTYFTAGVTVNGEHLFSSATERRSGTYTVGGVLLKYNSNPETITITGPTTAIVTAQVREALPLRYRK